MSYDFRLVPTCAYVTEGMVLNAIHESAWPLVPGSTKQQIRDTLVLRYLGGMLPEPSRYFSSIVDSYLLKLLEKCKITLIRHQDMPTNRDLVRYRTYQIPVTRIVLYLPSEAAISSLRR
ncbi:hypothetical protein KP509_32G032500 [Ceratopteris richardii]|uniref:Uncharacterized protein n=1 Tax=Ceratopteris richardii TaxID=49495 RepID=A0A8T2QTS1_CERRI|nr:hypothetical protein KP509_32G032500 [Ceratopteris richardii]